MAKIIVLKLIITTKSLKLNMLHVDLYGVINFKQIYTLVRGD